MKNPGTYIHKQSVRHQAISNTYKTTTNTCLFINYDLPLSYSTPSPIPSNMAFLRNHIDPLRNSWSGQCNAPGTKKNDLGTGRGAGVHGIRRRMCHLNLNLNLFSSLKRSTVVIIATSIFFFPWALSSLCLDACLSRKYPSSPIPSLYCSQSSCRWHNPPFILHPSPLPSISLALPVSIQSRGA